METNLQRKLQTLQTLQMGLLTNEQQDATICIHVKAHDSVCAPYICAYLLHEGKVDGCVHLFNDNDDTEFNEFVTNCANIINNN